jgi:hypothetical protein
MTDDEKVRHLLRLIEREKRKARPDKSKIRALHREISEIKKDWRVTGRDYQGGPKDRPNLWKEPQQRRPPHNKDDQQKLRDFLRGEISGHGIDATDVLMECARLILWARRGRTKDSKAMRLGIIAGVPVADLARELDVYPQAVYEQAGELRSKMGNRSIITSAIAQLYSILERE